jgi:hypothetical protein
VIKGEIPRVDRTARLRVRRSRTSIGGKHNMEDAIQSQIARMFHKGQEGSSGRSSALARDTAETMPMAGDVKRSSGRDPQLTCRRRNKLM